MPSRARREPRSSGNGELHLPEGAKAIVFFAYDSGSRLRLRNHFVARELWEFVVMI